MKPPTHKEELQQRDHLGVVSRKNYCGAKPVLLARNLTLNFDAAPNYKYSSLSLS